MQSFNLIDNSLIKHIDKQSIYSPNKETPLQNTLKTVIKRDISYYLKKNNVFYSNQFVVDIPKQYDNLSQVFIKTQLFFPDSSINEAYIGLRIFEKITIKTKNGVVLQTIIPEYSTMRFNEFIGSPTEQYLETCLQPSGPDPNDSPFLVLPLFAFFSDSLNCMLRTRPIEPLEIVFEIVNNAIRMGTSQDVVDATFETYFKYFDIDDSNRAINQLDSIKNKSDIIHKLPKTLYGSYDIFQEDRTELVVFSTTAKLLLRCPFPVFNICCTLVAVNDASTARINNLKIITGGSEIVNIDYRMNFELFGKQRSFRESSSISYFFNKIKSRTVDSGLIVFNENMFPSYLELEFDPLPDDYVLVVFCEYRSVFEISKEGRINKSTDYASLMDQQNSALEK